MIEMGFEIKFVLLKFISIPLNTELAFRSIVMILVLEMKNELLITDVTYDQNRLSYFHFSISSMVI